MRSANRRTAFRIGLVLLAVVFCRPLWAVNVLTGKAQLRDPRTMELTIEKNQFSAPLHTTLCADAASCALMFFFEDRSPLNRPLNFALPAFQMVAVSDDPSMLVATLDGDLAAFDDILAVAKSIDLVTDTKGTVKPFRIEFAFPLSISDVPHDPTPRLRLDVPLPIPASQIDLSMLKIKDTDTGQDVRVHAVLQPCADRCNRFFIDLADPYPPGRTLSVSLPIAGVGKAGGTVKTPAGPKNRDEAQQWISLQGVLTQGSKDTYAVDTKLTKLVYRRPLPLPGGPADNDLHFRFKEWNGVVDVNAGSDKLKLPDYGAFSLPALFQMQRGTGTTVRTLGTLSLAPEFRTDKGFDNRDLGVSPLFQPIINSLNHSLAQRRKSDPTAQSGHSLTLAGGAEVGSHLASQLPAIEHSTFARSLIKATETVEWKQWKLSTGLQYRHLFRDELAKDDKDVLRIGSGERFFARTELAYDLGFAALSIVNTSGRVPPAFKRARATTIGVTFKR
jgi:hypothetical protein